MKKIKDLNQYLTDNTGLNKDEREQWRNKISEMMKTDREEAMKVFHSTQYFKAKYLMTAKERIDHCLKTWNSL
jgi:hypothetical protein